MTSQSMIVGTIDGIRRNDFERLKGPLRRCFEEVGWKDGALVIKSSRDHDSVKEIFAQIADCVQPDKFGSLLYVGHGNVACFFFGHKRYVGRRFKEPAPPDWWQPGLG